jgi:hypothetical protein
MSAMATGTSGPATKFRIFEPDSKFRDDFDRNSFLFSHHLAGHPLFELSRIRSLAEMLLQKKGPTSIRWKNSDAPVDAGWAQLPPSEQIHSVSDAIQNIDKSGSWVLLYGTQNDPEYAALLEQILDEVEEMMGHPLRSQISWKECHIFMVSPNGTTPYHVDHMTTFLFQIQGSRIAKLWDQKDRSILTDKEIENFYMGDHSAAKYEDWKQDRAYVYPMEAGKGVHHPHLAPHHYKNGDTYSIGLGVHLCLKDDDRQARAYQMNACLRQIGLKPEPPGLHPLRDRLKIGAVHLFDKKKPASIDDVVRSGALRLKAPFRLVKKLKG